MPPATGVTNNANFKITSANANVSLGGLYTQTVSANLLMNWYQRVSAGGAASLGGTLTLFNTSGNSMTAGRYTLMTAVGVTSTFASLNHSNLPNAFTYALAYDANNVYLDVISSTQASLVAVASPSSISVNGTSALTTTGGSGTGAVTFSLVSGPCTLIASTLTGTGAGSCIVTATKAADGTFSSATSAAIAVAVAEVLPVPTISEWTMIFLAVLMGMFAFVQMRRRIEG